MDSTTSPPSQYELDRRNTAYAEAQSDYDDATSTLSNMSELRQAADDKLIAAIGQAPTNSWTLNSSAGIPQTVAICSTPRPMSISTRMTSRVRKIVHRRKR